MAHQAKPRSAGRRRARYEAYYTSGRLLAKKLRNVIRSCGYDEGVRWAKANQAEGILNRFENAKNPQDQPLRWLARAKVKARQRAQTAKKEQTA